MSQIQDIQPSNQAGSVDTHCDYSPCQVTMIALGTLILIGSALATWLLHAQLGNVAYSCLSAMPIGIALIVLGFRCVTASNESPAQGASGVGAALRQILSLRTGDVIRDDRVSDCKFYIEVKRGEESLCSKDYVFNTSVKRIQESDVQDIIQEVIPSLPEDADEKITISWGIVSRTSNKMFDFYGLSIDVDFKNAVASNRITVDKVSLEAVPLKRAHDYMAAIGIQRPVPEWREPEGFV